MRKVLCIVGALLLSGYAFAGMPQKFVIDEDHTFPRIGYEHAGFSTQSAKFNRTWGTVVYDDNGRSSSVDVTIDMRSINTGVDKLNAVLQNSDFFDTQHYPKAYFRSTNVLTNDGVPKSVEGELTIKGTTRFVTLDISSFKRGKGWSGRDTIGADARTRISRSDYGIMGALPFIGDDIQISIAIEATAN